MKLAVRALFGVLFPKCKNHPAKIATYECYLGYYCDECHRAYPTYNMAEFEYAAAVREIESDGE